MLVVLLVAGLGNLPVGDLDHGEGVLTLGLVVGVENGRGDDLPVVVQAGSL